MNTPDGTSLFSIDFPVTNTLKPLGTNKWALEPIYKVGATDKWLVWQIMFDGSRSSLITKAGYIGGKQKENSSNVVLNKSGRNIQEQAFLEAVSKNKKKRDNGYLTLPEIGDGGLPVRGDNLSPTSPVTVGAVTTIPKQFKVMLANDYDPRRITKWPVAGEVKLDGIRAYTSNDPSQPYGIGLRSRNHNEFPHLNHIRFQIANYLRYLPTGTILDGELYSHAMTFNEISSAVRRKGNIHPRNTELKYYIFEIFEPEKLPFEKRYNLLVRSFQQFTSDGNDSSNLVIVPMTMFFVDEDIKNAETNWTQQGFEGVMVRPLGGKCVTGPIIDIEYIEIYSGLKMNIKYCELGNYTPESIKLSQYKGGRNYNLMKYKTFKDEEGVVVDIKADPRTGSIVIVLRDIRGNTFQVNPSGRKLDHQDWLLNKNNYIGLPYTFKYKELSEYNVPREPIGIAFRTYE
jgi:hypothetical protein